MDLHSDDGSRGRIARLVLAAVLAVVAIRSFRKGKRTSGALAAVGAVVLGRDAAVEVADQAGRDEMRIDVGADHADRSDGAAGRTDDAALYCAICGEPIVPGQARGPGPNDEIVHDACEEALA